MTEKVFVDSNVLVYAHDADAGDKQRIAANIVISGVTIENPFI
jgi:predicted nucleic acid-binding protein